MKKNRLFYLLLTLLIIIIGILSRKISFIPFFIGDLLYAIMVYFGIRFLFKNLSRNKSAIIAMLTCYCIELLQLCSADWINKIKATTLGRYALGQGFLWSDLIAYSVGILIVYYADKLVIEKKSMN